MSAASRYPARPDIALGAAALGLAGAFQREIVSRMPLWRLALPRPGGHEQLADLLGADARGAARFGVFLVATLACYAGALLLARRATRGSIFVAAPCLFVAVLLAASPTASRDVYHYLAEGRLLAGYGIDPLSTAPGTITTASDPILSALVDWRQAPAAYGTLHVALMAAVVTLGGGKVATSILLVRLLSCVAYLGTTVVVALLSPVGERREATVAFAWNPLVLFEGIVNLHNDLWMAALASAAVLATVRRRHALAAVLFVASALVKFATVPVAFLALAYALGADPAARRRVLGIAGLGVALGVALYVPFMGRWSDTPLGKTSTASSLYAIASLLAPGSVRGLRVVLLAAATAGIVAMGVRLLRRPTTSRLVEYGAVATGLGLLAAATSVWAWYAVVVVTLGAPSAAPGMRRWLFLLTAAFLGGEAILVWRWVFGVPQWNGPGYTWVSCGVMYGPLVVAGCVAVVSRARGRAAG